MKHTDIPALVVDRPAVRHPQEPNSFGECANQEGRSHGTVSDCHQTVGDVTGDLEEGHAHEGLPLPQPIDVLRPSVNPVVELEAKEGQQPQSYPEHPDDFYRPGESTRHVTRQIQGS